jgi:hypothetical protein
VDQLTGGNISEIDFDQLAKLLKEAQEVIGNMNAKARISDALIHLFKEELICKARATARARGKSAEFIERIITADELNLEDLVKLKKEIEEEFDFVFSRKLKEPTGAAGGGEKLVEFKVREGEGRTAVLPCRPERNSGEQ